VEAITMNFEEIETNLNIIAFNILENILNNYHLNKNEMNKVKNLLYFKKIVSINPFENLLINIEIDEVDDDFLNHYTAIIIKKIFNLIIDAKVEINEFKNEFKNCIKTGLVELYTNQYCINEDINYKMKNSENVLFAKELIDGVSDEIKLYNYIFSLDDLLKLSTNSYRLYLQFLQDNSLNIHIKKYIK
jgi:hypothetical protein